MGDSSGGRRRETETPAAPANPNPTSTVQPFMPRMDQMLAQQLAMGFGGTPQDFLTAFAQTYAPMQVPQNAVFTPPADKKNTSSSGNRHDHYSRREKSGRD